jgi:high-affinity Fe2+/Pb2+ permease
MKLLASTLAVLALCLTVIHSILVFNGTIENDLNKNLMMAGTVLWFVAAPIWFRKGRGDKS